MINEAQILAAAGGGTDEKGKYFRDAHGKKVYSNVRLQQWQIRIGLMAAVVVVVGIFTKFDDRWLVLCAFGAVIPWFVSGLVCDYIIGTPESYNEGLRREKVERAKWEDTIAAMPRDPHPAPPFNPSHPL